MASFRPNGLPGRQEGGKLGELVGYRQQHVFKDWDDVKQHANLRVDEVANLYGPGLADQITPLPERLIRNLRDGNLLSRVTLVGRISTVIILLTVTTVP